MALSTVFLSKNSPVNSLLSHSVLPVLFLLYWSIQRYIIIIYHRLSLNREGRWGKTDDFATSFLHFYLFSTALLDLANSRRVHSLMLSSHLFLCLPRLLSRFGLDLMNGRHVHTTAVCVSLRWSGDLHVVRLLQFTSFGVVRSCRQSDHANRSELVMYLRQLQLRACPTRRTHFQLLYLDVAAEKYRKEERDRPRQREGCGEGETEEEGEGGRERAEGREMERPREREGERRLR